MLCTTKCVLCDMFEEDISHMLWRCPEQTKHREMGIKRVKKADTTSNVVFFLCNDLMTNKNNNLMFSSY